MYDSLSGHGFLIGCRSGKVVEFGVLKKKCFTCEKHNTTQQNIPEHRCNVNHVGSSGSMESTLALRIVEGLHKSTKKKAYVQKLVTDDDSTMRSNLCHNDKKAKLNVSVPEPAFLADPGHRVKVMVKGIFT